MILKVLRAEGNVLLPVETAGRVLELILHLESVSARKLIKMDRICFKLSHLSPGVTFYIFTYALVALCRISLICYDYIF